MPNESNYAPHFTGFLWLFAGVLVATLMALGLPWFAQRVPWSLEKKMAATLGRVSLGEECRGSLAAQDAFRKILSRIYPIYPIDHGFPIHVNWIKGNEVNAFATLGGEIYVYSGLLAQARSSEELAGVLAHEIEHVHHRHIMQSVIMKLAVLQGLGSLLTGAPGGGTDMTPQIAQIFLTMKFSRNQETEADEDGFKRLHDGQVDVHGLQNFFTRLEDSGAMAAMLSDHPLGADRARLAERFAYATALPLLTPVEWKRVQGLCR